ncbi:exopolysaccharide production protein YjbE [Kosakonia oryzendophytica]|uniref:exopolysaccharide production protein YjbE n=1 Tax=Kosakonia oryzendophytica TaxID=1005665 RepID=UPI003D32DB8F
MIPVKCIILLFTLTLTEICYAAPAEKGTAAGSQASDIAIGSSALTGTAIVVGVAGVLLLSMGGGNDGSTTSTNTSTTTTTSTTP